MIQEENILDCLSDFVVLALENGKEIYGETYAPSISSFISLSQSGALKVYTVRKNKKLIGYALYIVSAKLHERYTLCAECNTIFVKKEYRGNIAQRLVTFAEKQLVSLGVNQIQYQARPAFKKFFKRLGYGVVEYTYRKEV